MVPQWVIEKKRDGGALDEADIRAFIRGYSDGTIPDYQMAALAMAIYFKGMTFDETAILTDAMMNSGDVLDLSAIPLPKADKHSTGGIGDKLSLILAPLVACFDIAVPMLSGRGLGITGGTLDKLESIPGFRTDLSAGEFIKTVAECGCAITGQTPTIAPADRKLYALRDVTGTVPSIPLISSSIMSKKLAEGTDVLVLDVKVGSGAFMKDAASARTLAETMVAVGRRMGKKTRAVLTDMNQPLGRAVGNALEVREAIEVLQGGGPRDVIDLTVELSAHMLVMAGRSVGLVAARQALLGELAGGRAFRRFVDMVERQGGRADALTDPDALGHAKRRAPLASPSAGIVNRVDAGAIGRACLILGAGRRRIEDRIDPLVGIDGLVKVGQSVEAGAPLATVHANSLETERAALAELAGAFEVSPQPSHKPKLIGDIIE